MAAVISGATLTAFNALPSLEAQIVFLVEKGVTLQNTYNTANPTSTQTRFAISPNYSTKTITGQFQLGLTDDAAEQTLHDNTVAFLP